jgi:hypothetical protein
MDKRWRDQVYVLPGQLQFVCESGRRQHEDCGGCTMHGGSAGQHRIVPSSGWLSSVGTLRRLPQESLRWSKVSAFWATYAVVRSHLIRIGDTTLTLSSAEIVVMPSPSDQRPAAGADIRTRHDSC